MLKKNSPIQFISERIKHETLRRSTLSGTKSIPSGRFYNPDTPYTPYFEACIDGSSNYKIRCVLKIVNFHRLRQNFGREVF